VNHNLFRGVLASILAFLLWGLFPIYWKLLSNVPAVEILAHRIVWANLFLLILILFNQKIKLVKTIIKEKKILFYLTISSILVGLNWYLYIWAVHNNLILQASLGYYINPLLSIFVGIFLFKESLSKVQFLAITLAVIGVTYFATANRQLPIMAILIASSFCFYGVVHKLIKKDPIITLFIETTVLGIPSLIYLLTLDSGGNFLTANLKTSLLLAASGIVTAIPLLLFIYATNKVKLSSIGITQYLAPTGQFLCGVFLYNEQLNRTSSITFFLIWTAVILYAISQFTFTKKNNRCH